MFWRNGKRQGWWRRLLARWRLALHHRASPEQIGRGTAIGIFCGFALPPGCQILPAIAIAQFSGAHVPAAALGTLVTNPLTAPFLFPLAAWIGSRLTGIALRAEAPEGEESFWRLVADPSTNHGRMLMLLFVGGLVMGSVGSVLAYGGMIGFVKWRRRKKEIGQEEGQGAQKEKNGTTNHTNRHE